MSNKTGAITLRIEPKIKDQIKAFADKERRSMSQQVTWIIVEYLAKNKKG
jgi:hypothetical protein